MENGMYAAVKTDDRAHAVFIDQETLEFDHLNRRSKANRQKNDKLQGAEEARKRKLHRITARTVKQELVLVTAMAAVYYGLSTGMVSVSFAVPVQTVLLAVSCFKAGKFFARILRLRR